MKIKDKSGREDCARRESRERNTHSSSAAAILYRLQCIDRPADEEATLYVSE